MFNLAGYAVRSAMRIARPSFPELSCVEASLILQQLLLKLGHQARLMSGVFRFDKPLPNSVEEPEEGLTLTYAHHWVEVGNTVIDITGDQFEHGLYRTWPAVYIGTRSDRYLDPVEDARLALLDDPTCQAVLFELQRQFPGFVPVEGPEDGLGVRDFTWWDGRDFSDQKRFMIRLDALGKKVASLLAAMTFRVAGRILPKENAAWITWAPPKFGDNKRYRHRPHITLDVTPKEVVLHLNLELAENADHFVALARRDAGWILDQAKPLGDNQEFLVYQRRHIQASLWELERPVSYPLCDLTPKDLLEAVNLAQAWGKRERTRQAYFFSQRIPAARAIALGAQFPTELARRIERLRPGLDCFDWKQ